MRTLRSRTPAHGNLPKRNPRRTPGPGRSLRAPLRTVVRRARRGSQRPARNTADRPRHRDLNPGRVGAPPAGAPVTRRRMPSAVSARSGGPVRASCRPARIATAASGGAVRPAAPPPLPVRGVIRAPDLGTGPQTGMGIPASVAAAANATRGVRAGRHRRTRSTRRRDDDPAALRVSCSPDVFQPQGPRCRLRAPARAVR